MTALVNRPDGPPGELSLTAEAQDELLLLSLPPVAAGFPSPAADYQEPPLDLLQYLVKRPQTTFFMRVVGDSMTAAGIRAGDLLVIDRAAPIVDRAIVIARLGDEFCCKQLRLRDGGKWLHSANPAYEPLQLAEDEDAEIWGRVLHAITSYTNKLP
jgi:DNA polymerase V